MKYFYVVREKDGATMDVPENHLAETLQRGFRLLGEAGQEMEQKLETQVYENKKTSVEPIPEKNVLECPICGFIAKSEFGLKVHKRKHYEADNNIAQ